jgi:3-deoxy-D-manno-octulosonate 8-phosphate phosphatase (KDO 8-P phosphatase)
MNLSAEAAERAARVRLFVTDNDAVLTDGRIVLGDYGDELKFFDVQDGHGLSLLRRAGIPVVMVSGRKCKVNVRRAKEVGIAKVFQNVGDKLKVFEKALKKFRVTADQACYVGDDLPDVPALRRAGFAVAVSNAVPEVKGCAHYVTERSGGRGAVRETADLILKAQGKWQELTAEYFR